MGILGNRLFSIFIFCASLSILAGCTTRLGDFTALSTKNVDVSGLKPGDRNAGEDCINVVLGFPIGDINWKNAMDQALERGKGDVMVDVVLTHKYWSLLGLFGQQCVEIAGTVSQTASYRR